MYIVVYVTAKDVREGKKIATKLVEKKLAACVNIVSGIKSIFSWENKVCEEKEVLLVIKSKKTQFKNIIACVKSVHSYSVPEIIALPIVNGERNYLDWIKKEVK